jgi:hypothetical protein
MTGAFHSQIRKSLADANLQSALDANSARRIQVRKGAFDSLPDALGRRERAHDIWTVISSNSQPMQEKMA